MSAGDLLEKYKNDPRLFGLADKLTFAQPQKIILKNLFGAISRLADFARKFGKFGF